MESETFPLTDGVPFQFPAYRLTEYIRRNFYVLLGDSAGRTFLVSQKFMDKHASSIYPAVPTEHRVNTLQALEDKTVTYTVRPLHVLTPAGKLLSVECVWCPHPLYQTWFVYRPDVSPMERRDVVAQQTRLILAKGV